MQVVIEAYGETIMQRRLLRFEQNLSVPVAALEAAGTMLRASTERQFDSEGGASGGWAPLAASTVAQKQRQGMSPMILQATGLLKESLTRKFDPHHTERLSADTLTFGSTVPYGIFHQTGTRKMPRRPPIGVTEADKVEMIKVMQKALLAGVLA